LFYISNRLEVKKGHAYMHVRTLQKQIFASPGWWLGHLQNKKTTTEVVLVGGWWGVYDKYE
jgi:hypothetical protein